MKHSVCIIEPNPKVRTLIHFGLSRQKLAIVTLESADHALTPLIKIRPSVVLCAHDPKRDSALQLCAQLKAHDELKHIRFVITAPKRIIPELESKAAKYSVDELFAKPFKSDDLDSLVRRLIASINPQEHSSPTVMVLTQDALLLQLLARLIDRRNALTRHCEGPSDAISFCQKTSATAIVVDSKAAETLDWYKPKKMGSLVLITTSDTQLLPKQVDQERLYLLSRPLSAAKIEETLSHFLPEPTTSVGSAATELEPREQSLFAARISAAIYETLLNQPALRTGNWHEAADLARAEVLHICRTLEKLITAG